MKAQYYILTAIIITISSTTLFAQKSVFTFPFENSKRLPAMETYINTDEISNTYQTMGHIYTTEITGLGDNKMEQTSMSFISDAKVVDAMRFLEFYMEEQLIAPGDPTGDLVEMSIIYYHERNRFSIGSVLGILTLGIGTLCGIPYATAITDVEIKASFFNEEDQLISNHRGVGRGKKQQIIYSMTTRKAHQKAIKKALEDLNTRIMGDSILFCNPEP